MTITPSNLIDSVRSWIVWLIFRDSDSAAPISLEISGYKLVAEVKKDRDRRKYATGIYSRSGRKYFIKTWAGIIPNFDYFDLVNEFFCGRLLHRYLGSGLLATPWPIKYIHSHGRLSVIFEYVSGHPLSQFPVRYQKQMLTKISIALNSLPAFLPGLPHRGAVYFLASTVNLSLVSILSQSASPRQVWSRFRSCLIRFPGLLKSPRVVSHRDFFSGNVLVSRRRAYLLDCASLAYTPPGYDLAYLAKRDRIQLPLPHPNREFFDSYIYLMSSALQDL